jgi:hypothetical protein
MVKSATTTFGMQNSPRILATSSPLHGSSTALFLPLIASFCNNSSFPHVVWIYITSVVAGFLSANHEGNEWSRDISATQGFWQNQASKQENCNTIIKGEKTMEETRKRTWKRYINPRRKMKKTWKWSKDAIHATTNTEAMWHMNGHIRTFSMAFPPNSFNMAPGSLSGVVSSLCISSSAFIFSNG